MIFWWKKGSLHRNDRTAIPKNIHKIKDQNKKMSVNISGKFVIRPWWLGGRASASHSVEVGVPYLGGTIPSRDQTPADVEKWPLSF